MDFCWNFPSFWQKREDFLRSFIFLGGVEMFGCYTFEIFWLTWYLQLSAWGLFWWRQYPLETSLVPKRTSLPTQRKRLAHSQSTQSAGGGLRFFNISIHFHLLHKMGPPSLVVTRYIISDLSNGWDYFSPPKSPVRTLLWGPILQRFLPGFGATHFDRWKQARASL